jgi:hypothetical protein
VVPGARAANAFLSKNLSVKLFGCELCNYVTFWLHWLGMRIFVVLYFGMLQVFQLGSPFAFSIGDEMSQLRGLEYWMSSKKPRLMPRTDCRLRVRFGLAGNDHKRVAYSNNVSAHGMFLCTSRVEDPGSHIWLEVDLPDGTAMLRAIVVWQRQVHVSLRSVTKPGIGLLVVQAPESWYRFLVSLSSNRGGEEEPLAG